MPPRAFFFVYMCCFVSVYILNVVDLLLYIYILNVVDLLMWYCIYIERSWFVDVLLYMYWTKLICWCVIVYILNVVDLLMCYCIYIECSWFVDVVLYIYIECSWFVDVLLYIYIYWMHIRLFIACIHGCLFCRLYYKLNSWTPLVFRVVSPV